MDKMAITRAQAFEELENVGSNASENACIGEVIATRYHRRDILKGALGVAAIAATVSPLAIAAAQRANAASAGFQFKEVSAGVDERHHVADGYDSDILIRWGDPVLPGAPAFDPARQSAAAQKMQFGYNNDFLGYLPMPGAANPSQHGLLVVNHEYTNEELMFPGLGAAGHEGCRFQQDDQRTGRYRDGGTRRRRHRDQAGERQVARGR